MTKLTWLIFLIPSLALSQWQIGQRNFAPVASGGAVVTLATSNGSAGGSSSYTSFPVTLSGGNTGDLVACAFNAGPATISSLSMSDGTNTLTALAGTSTGGYYSQLFYILSATAPSLTYTATITGGAPYPELSCFDFHTTSGTWHYAASSFNYSSSSASLTTGTITTTGSAEAVVMSTKLYATAATTSAPLINGVTPLEPSWSPIASYDHQYYYLPTAPFTGQGTLTYSTATTWTTGIGAWYAQ